MSDISFAEIAARIPEGDPVKAFWAAAALPADTTVNEFFCKSLKAASDAARLKNANLTSGFRISGYPNPVTAAPITDASSGEMSFLVTYSVQGRVIVGLDNTVSPLQ